MWTLPARIYNLSYLCREPINIIPEKKLDKKNRYILNSILNNNLEHF